MASAKSFLIPIRQASSLPVLTAPDGEVESYANIPWLQQTATTPSSSKKSVTLTATTSDTGFAIPGASKPLCVHFPPSFPNHCILIYIQANNGLGMKIDNANSQNLPASWPASTHGALIKAVTSGDSIMLIGSKGILYLLFDPENTTYIPLPSLPEAPAVTVSLDRCDLPGYIYSEDADPTLNISIPVEASLNIPEVCIQAWITEGKTDDIPQLLIDRLFAAVEEATARYCRDVAAAGLTLTPFRYCASLKGHLPSYPALSTHLYHKPTALVTAWNYRSHKLSLTLSFSLPPLKPMAVFNASDLQLKWRPVFGSLEIHTAPPASWCASENGIPRVVSFASVFDPVTNRRLGRGFHFNALSQAEMTESIATHAGYTTRAAFNISTTSRLSAYVSLTQNLGQFTPDYTEHKIITPTLVYSGDAGPFLFGGMTKISDEFGVFHEHSLQNSLLPPLPDCPFIFGSPVVCGNAPLHAIARAPRYIGMAPSSRQPLFAFSADGIRLLSSRSDGLYRVSRIISSKGTPTTGCALELADETAYFSHSGLQILSSSLKIKTCFEQALADCFRDSPSQYLEMHFAQDADVLLLKTPQSVILYDLLESARSDIQLSLPNIITIDGSLHTVDSTGRIRKIEFSRVYSAETLPSQLRTISSGEASFTTRALKLGDFSAKKHLRSVECSAGVMLQIEGSDDLTRWHPMAGGYSPLNALRLPAFKFWRVSASTSAGNHPKLALLKITLR